MGLDLPEPQMQSELQSVSEGLPENTAAKPEMDFSSHAARLLYLDRL